ncbi:hypothetical protein B0T18DRAFT_413548 [Schizothecium vesticola]|uniref:Uncharacterized protein n=1 Tax=Schizothecium vesticola TaxID=314040 RepID=A0AA40ENR7_9PEZI|nr:hypothetical protein B0T18DRAFT_413548 [Schizothecium vesticola]
MPLLSTDTAGLGGEGCYIKPGMTRATLTRLANSLEDRCFCIAESDHRYVVGPYGSRPGDVVAVFEGEKKPYVLREKGSGRFELVGDAFVSDIMTGDLFEGGNLEELAVEMLTLS